MSRVLKPPILAELPPEKGVVQASAGTGKTYVLERIVIDLVLRGYKLEEILVVTFTEKATLELKGRIRAMLERMAALPEAHVEAGEPAWTLDPAGVGALQAALRGFDRATIATIHGFCRRVLQESAFEGGALLRQELADGRSLLGRAWREVVRRDAAAEPALGAFLGELVARGWSFDALEDLLWSAHTERGELHPPPAGDPEAVLAAYPAGWQARGPELDAAVAALDLHGNTRRAFRNKLQAFFAVMERRPSAFGLRSGWEFEYLEEKDILAKGGAGHELFEWLAAFARAAGTPEALVVHRLLPRVQARLRAIKDAEGLYDHDDTILQVQAALAGPMGADLAARLRERYRAALIDEFQDTDQSQWGIFRTLFSGPGHLLYVIGDPKQAIYGFRGGDLPTYREAARTLLGADRPRELAENHRSTRAVIDAYNRIFTGGARDAEGRPVTAFFSDPDLYPAASAVGCGNPGLATRNAGGGEPAPVRVLRFDTLDGGRGLWQRVARALAREIKGLVQGGIAFGDPGAGDPGRALRRLHFGDVMVLVEKRRQGREMAEALGREGVPFSFFKQDGLLASAEAVDLLDCLEAALDPRDRTRLARALVTPFFGYGWPDLEALDGLPEDHPALDRLRDWQALAHQRQFPRLFEAMLHGGGLVQRLRLAEGGERALTNHLHLTELLIRHARDTSADLEDLVRLMKRWQAGTELPPGENGDLQRLEGERQAVQILTMHQSKGLEAPIVALYGFTRPNTRGAVKLFHQGGRRCAYLGTPPEAVKAEVEREREAEAERLLYVAITRARAQLLLPCFVADRKGLPAHPDGNYRIVNRRLREILEREAGDGLFLAVAQDGPGAAPGAPEPAPDLGGWTAPEPPVPALPDYDAIRRAARPPLTTSYTALHAFHAARREPEDAEEMVLDGEQVADAPAPAPGDLPRGARTGILLHQLLEQADLKGAADATFEAWWADPDRRAWIDAALAAAGMAPQHGARAARMVYDALQAPLAGAPLARQEPVLRELQFLARYLDTGSLFQGAMDVLFERDGRIHLLDWKSDSLADYGAAALDARVRSLYWIQIQIYLNVVLDYFGIEDEDGYERRFGALHYVFLRGLPGAGVWTWRPAWAELLAWRRDLRALHDQVTAHV